MTLRQSQERSSPINPRLPAIHQQYTLACTFGCVSLARPSAVRISRICCYHATANAEGEAA
jgi:hypothetical protein